MTSIAELGIKVDSGDASQAATELDKLAAAGGRAEKAAEGVASGFDKASSSAAGLSSAEGRLSETTEEAMARLTAMAKASLESSQYVQGLGGSVTSTASAMDGGKAAARDWNAEIAAINSRAQALLATEDRLAEESRKAAAATGVQAEGLQALLGKINPTIAALDRLDEQQAQLQKYKNAGLIDVETFSEYAGRIDSSRQKLGDLDESLQKTGRTTNQTQQALRQLPSQFTDIFTSLAGGQNPLLVLIQQGGQIADSFGGIGPTLDVMGQKIRSVLGLGGGIGAVGDALDAVGSGAKAAADGADAASDSLGGLAEGANTAADAAKNAKEATDALSTATPPLSSAFGLVVAGAVALAAAIATVIYGYSQGSKEADKYNQALILTGNRAGKTADQLASMAQQVAATNGTVGEAAASLVLIANSGTIASDSFKTVADAAAAMEDATGQAVEKTVAEFAKIGMDPVAAAKELNQQYGFLTAAVYSQVVALKEQGDSIGAAKLLTDTYANTMTERSGEITKNLGLWERGWKAVGDETKKSIDSLKEFGREQTLADKITNAQQRVAAAQSAVNGNPVDTDAQEKLTNSRLELQYLTQQRDTQAAIAAARGADAQRQQATILALTKVDALEKSARTNAEKRADAQKDYDKSLETIRKTNPNDDRLKPENIARVRANINDQFKDPKQSAGAVDLTGFNDAQNQLKSVTSYYDNIQKELDAAQKAGLVSAESYASQRVAIVQQEQVEVTAAYEAEISALEAARAKGTTSAEQRIQLDQKIADARAGMVKAQQDADTELNVLASNEQGRLKKQELAVQTYTSALEQQVKTLREQGQRSAATLGMGDRQRGLFDQQNGIDDRINQQKVELANQYGDGSRGMSLDEYNQKLAALNKTQKDLRDTVQTNYDDMTAAQGSWSAGASSAFQNYLDSAKDVAGQTKSLFTSAFSSMEDAIVNFAMTGKLSFADFAKSILADMARIAARQASSEALSALFGLASSAAGSYFGGSTTSAGSTSAGYSDAALSGWSGVQQAKGGAWSGGVQMFASGGAFTNSVVSKPTAFGMSGGQTGVMGEAGPEAIMPLTRTAGGQLGVRSVGGANAAGGTVISVQVNVAGDGTTTSTADDPAYEQFGKDLGDFVDQRYQKLISQDLRQGGKVFRAIRG
jgi:lambda family phage tail tape measure protein